MRLTPEHVKAATIRVNPIGDRELLLRGIGIRQLDEVALSQLITPSSSTSISVGGGGDVATSSKRQQAWRTVCDEEVDSLDLSDNLLGALDSVPTMRRVHTVLLHRNVPLQRISLNIAARLPSLHTLAASGCGFATLASLAPLASCRCLERVYFGLCPISTDVNRVPYNAKELLSQVPHNFTDALLAEVSAMEPSVVYRLYLIAICTPKLKLVDFARVKDAEREQAKRLKEVLLAVAAATSGSLTSGITSSVSTTDGKKIRKRSTLAQGGQQVVGGTAQPEEVATGQDETVAGGGEELTEETMNRMKEELTAKIESASTMEEMTELEEALEQLHAKEQQLKKLGVKRTRA